VHKSEVISNAILEQHAECIKMFNPDDLKFRPIVDGTNCVTQRLSHCIDIIFKSLCCEVPSFIRDVLEVLSHLPTTVNPNSELISDYVISLYSNIPHDLGISAIIFWLENKRNIGQQHFFKEFILETVKIILDRNVFYFVITLIDGKFYQQKRGTAMGAKMAPTYATLVLGYLEHILYEQLLNTYGQEFASYVRQNSKRFLDDCFIIWNSDIPAEIVHTELNSLNDYIRFTVNRSKIEMPFLDVLIGISTNNNIITDIFPKETDTHMYLNCRSSQPKHIKIYIPFNLASRIITITSIGVERYATTRT
jgi:hypothetical protein